jgi:hypothetical protein
MAVNKPVGDNARKGAVKKRSQLKTKVAGKDQWTKRDKATGEFMDVKKSKKEVQGRARGKGALKKRSGRESATRLNSVHQGKRNLCHDAIAVLDLHRPRVAIRPVVRFHLAGKLCTFRQRAGVIGQIGARVVFVGRAVDDVEFVSWHA